MKNMLRATVALLIATMLLVGCGGPKAVKMTAEDRSAVQTVKINADVARPAELYYYGPTQTIGILFGAIGGGLAGAAAAGPAQRIDKFATDNGVSIQSIAYDEISAAVRDSGKLKISEQAETSAPTMNIKVLMFGFSIPNGFSSKYVPIVGVQCDLVDAGGKVIWSANDRTTPLGSPVEPISSDALFNDPKAIESAWRTSLQRIAKNIVAEL